MSHFSAARHTVADNVFVGSLLLIGAPGAGKTTVLWELSGLLEGERVAHGAFESEQLSFGWPLLGARKCAPQLQALLALQLDGRRRLFLLTATPEDQGELDALIAAAQVGGRTLVACLCVSAELAAARVERREPESWRGRAALIEHARELAELVPQLAGIDLRLDSEVLAPRAIAASLAQAMKNISLCEM